MELLWRGTLAFELVHIPIGLSKATHTRRVPLRLLHEPDRSPIRYRKICEREGREVPDDEIVRGYSLGGEWVTLDDEEIDSASPRPTRSVQIRDFVSEHEVDPLLFRSPYHIVPMEGGEESYVTVREAIRRSGQVGVAEFVLRRREHLALVLVRGETLVLETLYYPEYLVEGGELELAPETQLREADIRLAVDLIERLSRPFEPSRYPDEYRARLLEVIRRKASGSVPAELEAPEEPEPTPVIDLTRRLRESLDRARLPTHRRAA